MWFFTTSDIKILTSMLPEKYYLSISYTMWAPEGFESLPTRLLANPLNYLLLLITSTRFIGLY